VSSSALCTASGVVPSREIRITLGSAALADSTSSSHRARRYRLLSTEFVTEPERA
jgi:hypothetical protein